MSRQRARAKAWWHRCGIGVVALAALGLDPQWCPATPSDSAPMDLNPFRACGLNCLFIVARMNHAMTTLPSLAKKVAPRSNGESSIADLERAAISLGLRPVAVRLKSNDLRDLPLPAIVHLRTQARQSDASHYVVLIGLHRDGVLVIDPPAGVTLHPFNEFAAEWTGVAVAFPTDRLSQERFLATLWWSEFWSIWSVRIIIGSGLMMLGGLTFLTRAWLRFPVSKPPFPGALP